MNYAQIREQQAAILKDAAFGQYELATLAKGFPPGEVAVVTPQAYFDSVQAGKVRTSETSVGKAALKFGEMFPNLVQGSPSLTTAFKKEAAPTEIMASNPFPVPDPITSITQKK